MRKKNRQRGKQYVKRNLDKIEITFNGTFTGWNACIRVKKVIASQSSRYSKVTPSHIATFTVNRHLGCLWSKIGTFQLGIELSKRATMLILNWMFKNTIESFQMRYYMQFFLPGYQICQNLKIYTSEFT